MNFACNICDAATTVEAADLTREGGTCSGCGSNVRLRSLALLVSVALFTKRLPISKWPVRPDLVGYGISDWPAFTKFFAPKFSYINTQFDREIFSEQPFLDITRPSSDMTATADVVTCSEVLEHVAPPVSAAFEGLANLLKPNGSLVFSVPYTFFDRTIEHYPELNDWAIHDIGGARFVSNVTHEGKHQLFDNPVFHGGGFNVLEMRIFALNDLLAQLRAAGFDNIQVLDTNVPRYGIAYPETWGRSILAKKSTPR